MSVCKGNFRNTIRFFILITVVIFAFCFAELIPYSIRSYSYAISLSIKEVMIFILPFVVFSIVLQSILKLYGNSAIQTVILLLLMIVISNTSSMLTASLVGKVTASPIDEKLIISTEDIDSGLEPAYTVKLKPVISNIKAAILGIVMGILLPRIPYVKTRCVTASAKLVCVGMFILEKIFTPLLPVFILGLVFRMQSSNLGPVLSNGSRSASYLLLSVVIYLCILYFFGSGFSIRKSVSKIRDMMTAALVALTTMSSFMTMGLVLKSVKKDSEVPEIFDITIPISLNVHLVGDCFFMIIMSFTILHTFHAADHITTACYINFLLHFLILKFAMVSVPGGGIMVMLPVIEEYLRFTPTMLSLITTLYVIFDPFITATNVLGNGAFSMAFSKVYTKLLRNTNQRV